MDLRKFDVPENFCTMVEENNIFSGESRVRQARKRCLEEKDFEKLNWVIASLDIILRVFVVNKIATLTRKTKSNKNQKLIEWIKSFPYVFASGDTLKDLVCSLEDLFFRGFREKFKFIWI